MTFKTFVMTDEWRVAQPGDVDDKDTQVLRRGITGQATLTPVLPEGLRVDDDPRAWMLLNREHKCDYHLGRLVGPDGLDGVRLVGWVDDKPVAWRVSRRLRFGGEWVAPLEDIVVAPVDGTAHLPDIVPVDASEFEKLPQVAVALDGVMRSVEEMKTGFAEARDNVSRAMHIADRTEKAAARIPDFEQAVRNTAEARDQAVGAASTATTKASEAAASATLADGRATDAEGAVASIAAHATAAEGAAGRAAVSESNAAGSATAAQGHADRAATEAGAAAQIAAQEKIAELVGDAPEQLDTIYELAAAFEDRGDAIAAIQDALANRVRGTHSSVISATIPGAGTPTNQITFVVEGE